MPSMTRAFRIPGSLSGEYAGLPGLLSAADAEAAAGRKVVSMSRQEILSCLEKRDLLNQPAVAVDKLLHWGRVFEEAEMLSDALDFFEKADSRDDLLRLFARAREEGDLFLFRRLAKALNHEPTSDEWLSLARRAEEIGKTAFALEAYRSGGHDPSKGESPEGSPVPT